MLPLISLACLLAGCTSFNPEKFGSQAKKWVPVGTPLAQAQRVMERHGFDCTVVTKDNPFNHEGIDFLECERSEVWLHTWTAKFTLKDDKVTGYRDLTVE